MKKFLFILLLIITSTICFAQNTDLKYYSDPIQGFSGCSVACYLEVFSKADLAGQESEFLNFLNDELSKKLTPVTKLTKNNNWLFHKALNEWDYERNEVYAVICADSKYAQDGILIFAIIKGKDDFIWRAYSVNVNDNIADLFKD